MRLSVAITLLGLAGISTVPRASVIWVVSLTVFVGDELSLLLGEQAVRLMKPAARRAARRCRFILVFRDAGT